MEEAAKTEAPAEIKEAKIVSPKERHADVPLDYPVEFDGKVYDTLRVRRVTGREVEEFLRAVANSKEGDNMPPPPMLECPLEVYNELDDDDRLRVEEAMLPFMPRRLSEAAGWTQTTSGTSSGK